MRVFLGFSFFSIFLASAFAANLEKNQCYTLKITEEGRKACKTMLVTSPSNDPTFLEEVGVELCYFIIPLNEKVAHILEARKNGEEICVSSTRVGPNSTENAIYVYRIE